MHIVNVKAVDKDGIIVYNMKLDLYSDDTRLLIDPKLKSLFNIYNLKDNKQTFYIDNNGNPTSHHLDSDNKIPLFHGLGQVIVKGNELVAECDGIKKSIIKWK